MGTCDRHPRSAGFTRHPAPNLSRQPALSDSKASLLSDISRGVATGPATFAPTNQLFDRRDTPIINSWIFAAHQIGTLAAFGAGAVRSFTGSYLLAFMTSGLASYDHPFSSDLRIESPGESAFEQRMGGRR
jgi:hypothetical protein